jgi:hypothetical protein
MCDAMDTNTAYLRTPMYQRAFFEDVLIFPPKFPEHTLLNNVTYTTQCCTVSISVLLRFYTVFYVLLFTSISPPKQRFFDGLVPFPETLARS